MLAYGAKMPRVNWLINPAQFNIPLPPEDEQRRIAAYRRQRPPSMRPSRRAQADRNTRCPGATIQHDHEGFVARRHCRRRVLTGTPRPQAPAGPQIKRTCSLVRGQFTHVRVVDPGLTTGRTPSSRRVTSRPPRSTFVGLLPVLERTGPGAPYSSPKDRW